MKGKVPNFPHTSHPCYGLAQIHLHLLIRYPRLRWNKWFRAIRDGDAVTVTPCAAVGGVEGRGDAANCEFSRCEEVISNVHTEPLNFFACHGLQLWYLLRDRVLVNIQCE